MLTVVSDILKWWQCQHLSLRSLYKTSNRTGLNRGTASSMCPMCPGHSLWPSLQVAHLSETDVRRTSECFQDTKTHSLGMKVQRSKSWIVETIRNWLTLFIKRLRQSNLLNTQPLDLLRTVETEGKAGNLFRNDFVLHGCSCAGVDGTACDRWFLGGSRL